MGHVPKPSLTRYVPRFCQRNGLAVQAKPPAKHDLCDTQGHEKCSLAADFFRRFHRSELQGRADFGPGYSRRPSGRRGQRRGGLDSAVSWKSRVRNESTRKEYLVLPDFGPFSSSEGAGAKWCSFLGPRGDPAGRTSILGERQEESVQP